MSAADPTAVLPHDCPLPFRGSPAPLPESEVAPCA